MKNGNLHLPLARLACAAGMPLAATLLACVPANAQAARHQPVIPQLTFPAPMQDSTVPANGDVNPYGVAFVPEGFPRGGPLNPGDIIVSNFNNSANEQGTGTTIVKVNSNAAPTLFFADANSTGFTTALGVLKAGFVLVGNLPSLSNPPGTCNTESTDVGQGGLLVVDKNGNLVTVLQDATFLDGPWDLTVNDEGQTAQIFVANALSATVTRLDVRVQAGKLMVEHKTQIASGYVKRCDSAAFVIAPTGLAFDKSRDILYVSSTGDNTIFAVHDASRTTTDAGTGDAVVTDQTHLHGPLGLALAPNGDLLSTQGDAINPSPDPAQVSEVVEFTPKGQFIAQFSVDPSAGSAFGIATRPFDDGFVFATVNDDSAVNALFVWMVR
jgi:hypothetical protein